MLSCLRGADDLVLSHTDPARDGAFLLHLLHQLCEDIFTSGPEVGDEQNKPSTTTNSFLHPPSSFFFFILFLLILQVMWVSSGSPASVQVEAA